MKVILEPKELGANGEEEFKARYWYLEC